MAKKIKLKKDELTVYPLTIPDAVIDPNTQKTIDEIYAAKEDLDKKQNLRDVKVISSDSYTLTADDINYFLFFTSDNEITFTISDVMPNLGAEIKGVQYGNGNINFLGVGQVEVKSSSGANFTNFKNEVFSLIRKDTYNFVLNNQVGSSEASETGVFDILGLNKSDGINQIFSYNGTFVKLSGIEVNGLGLRPEQYNIYEIDSKFEILDQLTNTDYIEFKYYKK